MTKLRVLMLSNVAAVCIACTAEPPRLAAAVVEEEAKVVYVRSMDDGRVLRLTVKGVPVRRYLEEHERKQAKPWRSVKPIEVYTYTFRLTDREGRVRDLYTFDHLVYDDMGVMKSWSDEVRVLDARVEASGDYVLLFKKSGWAHAVLGGAEGVLIPDNGPSGRAALLRDGESDGSSSGYAEGATTEGSVAEGTLRITFYDGQSRVRGRFRLGEVGGKPFWKRLPADGEEEGVVADAPSPPPGSPRLPRPLRIPWATPRIPQALPLPDAVPPGRGEGRAE